MLEEALPTGLRGLVAEARTATLATTRADGRPRLVPICFVLAQAAGEASRLVIHSPIDEKPKRTADPHRLARVADILARPEVELLIERWDEDWGRLAWVRLDGIASMLEPEERPEERRRAIAALRAKYPQYAGHRLEERPLLRIVVERIGWWSAAGPG